MKEDFDKKIEAAEAAQTANEADLAEAQEAPQEEAKAEAEEAPEMVERGEVERLVREAYLRGRNEAIEAKIMAEADFEREFEEEEELFSFRESVW